MIRLLVAAFLAALAAPLGSAAARSVHHPVLTAASIDAAAPNGRNEDDPALIAKAETLLDQAHFSPGEIDGQDGDNYRKALRAFQQANNLPQSGKLDAATWGALAASPVLHDRRRGPRGSVGSIDTGKSRPHGEAPRTVLYEPARRARRKV